MTSAVTLRPGRLEDVPAIQTLYRDVATVSGGIARYPDEITPAYIEDFLTHSLARGLSFVAESTDLPGLVGELHCYRSELRRFAHVLGELTVAVHPAAQGRGVGRALFDRLIDTVTEAHPDITRIELVTQESNLRALALYERAGFVREGRMEGRIVGPSGRVEADIPLGWLRPRRSPAH
jgi:putative acetyltransferase